MKTEQIQYNLPADWACAFINNDVSGMEDEDIQAMEKWLENNKESLGNGFWSVSEDEPDFYKYHDAHGYVLACDCLEFTRVIYL